MDELINILRAQLSYKEVVLEKEQLGIYQFPICKNGEQIDFTVLRAGGFHPQHIHDESTAKLYVITGKGVIRLNDSEEEYSAGDVFVVGKGTAYGFTVVEDTLLLSIQDSPILKGEVLDFRYK